MSGRFCLLTMLPNGFNIFHFHRYPWLLFLLQGKVHNHNRAITVGLTCNSYYSLSNYYHRIYFSNEGSVGIIIMKSEAKQTALFYKHSRESNTESALSWCTTYMLPVEPQNLILLIRRFGKIQYWFLEMYKERKKLFVAAGFTKFGIWFHSRWDQGMTQLSWFTDSPYEPPTQSRPVGAPGNKSCHRTLWICLCQRLPRQQQVTEQ